MTPPRVLERDLHVPECPRWRDGRLWFSDMHGHYVMTVDAAGRTEVVAQLPTQAAGLGWTPDGRLLAVSMVDRRLLRLAGARWETVADLARLASFRCNDMVAPAKQAAHAPQAMKGSAHARSPIRHPSPPAPTATTSPANSCPSTLPDGTPTVGAER